jgi:hypothetical protein
MVFLDKTLELAKAVLPGRREVTQVVTIDLAKGSGFQLVVAFPANLAGFNKAGVA